MARVKLQTGPGVFEVLAHVCRGAPEALKQFVENSADAIQQLGTQEGRILVRLDYAESPSPDGSPLLRNISVADNGVGMDPQKMTEVVQRIGDSEKVELALRGEKGIGILAFCIIADELHLASTGTDGAPSSCLVLKKGGLKTGQAEIRHHCALHSHTDRGTVAYLLNISPEIAPKLAKDRLKEYLGQEFASDLRLGLYAMSLSDDGESEPVRPQRYRGVKALSSTVSLGKLGSAAIELYVLPWELPDATVSLYGRAGMRTCLLTDLEDFKSLPWTDRRLEGYVRCDNLMRTADKTAVVHDQVYQALLGALRKAEPTITDMIDRISASSQERRFEVVVHKASRLIDRFLRYRDRGLLTDPASQLLISGPERPLHRPGSTPGPSSRAPQPEPGPRREPRQTYTRAPAIAFHSATQDKAQSRSWFDNSASCICINRDHPEFVLAQREDARCVRYLFTIWVKESLLQEYGQDAERLADEMVGMLAEAEPLLWT